MPTANPTIPSSPPARTPSKSITDELNQIIDDFTTWLLALCIETLSFTALLAKWIWIGLTLWWRFTVVLLFALLVLLGVNVLSLSLMGIGARYVYDWVAGLRREQRRDRFWAVRGRRRGR